MISPAEVALPVSFFIPGRARTKGSLKPIITRGRNGKIIVNLQESGEHSIAWKDTMIGVIRRQCGFERPLRVERRQGRAPRYVFKHRPYAGPVCVETGVVFEREHVLAGGVEAEELREASASPFPTSIVWGDGDKLERNVWDALTQSGLIEDDRWVVMWRGVKRFGPVGGIYVTVSAVSEDDA